MTSTKKRNHVLIAGTGRAGTSFLVKYLHSAGIETHINMFGDSAWNEQANAGFEDIPIPENLDSLPYVIKTPWAYHFIDELIEEKKINIELVIIPIRDLAEAAESRVVLELQSIRQKSPWFDKFSSPWNTWGTTPGGVVYSLDSNDQQRILAVGFHRLIERLVLNDIPFVFLSYPRFINDFNYLHSSLSKHFNISKKTAKKAHEKIADPKKVRIKSVVDSNTNELEKLDNTALRREIISLRKHIESLESKSADL